MDRIDSSAQSPYQQLAEELAAALRLGALPSLRFLYVGNDIAAVGIEHAHTFGQSLPQAERADRGAGLGRRELTALDDSVLLEQLRPTAALWWMAERAQHVRASKLHQWTYELDHGADVHATVHGLTILQWMHSRLALNFHSRAGHRAVHQLLVERGARETTPFVRHDLESFLGPAEEWGSDEYDTDYDERVADLASAGEGERAGT